MARLSNLLDNSYVGYTGSQGAGFTGSVGFVGSKGDTGFVGSAGTSASIVVSDTPPGGSINGDLWFDSVDGSLNIYYNDGTSSQWVQAVGGSAGVGGATGFGANGDGNSRVLDTNPYGATTTIWDVSNQDAVSDADGGWNTNSFSIDNTRMYRFSVWVRRKSIGNGSFYLGPQGLNAAGSNVGVLNRSNGVNNTNPYFIDRTWPSLAANTWYLMVGHVWPAGSGTGARQAGVSAQDLQKILPEVVSEDEQGLLSVNYGSTALVAVIELTKLVKQLQLEIEKLKAE